ncbi:SDR family oxidoreductase [Caballeronia sp. SEWSISQ10-4 2]|uniref:SDR family NAD(P)-dependent oxidoreductase n=1 Tax=Caballeronia sp. SEWSISQ10-4 2 TaxID=2937438 RepID=UPI0026564886|nr:SDR family NAD(P)-dependent oxidoreductase [Caballeronia sp. SEWSISQ10-4 2]MDN7177094.1 SDR family oxidoreductase [Caballeronia sp. SEWSISQ10-4 2]
MEKQVVGQKQFTTRKQMGVAVVTGGYRGIGEATCIELQRIGYTAVSLDINADPDNPLHYKCDLTDLKALSDTLDAVATSHGPIMVLVNNAGTVGAIPFVDVTPEIFDRTISINLRAMYFACQHVIKKWLADKRPGRIVNVASAAGRMGSPFVEYGASKAGVIGLTKGLARVVATDDIRVNAVAPGQIITDMHRRLPPERQKASLEIIPMKRSGTPVEIATVIAFLVSDASSFMTGAILDVNGGKH